MRTPRDGVRYRGDLALAVQIERPGHRSDFAKGEALRRSRPWRRLLVLVAAAIALTALARVGLKFARSAELIGRLLEDAAGLGLAAVVVLPVAFFLARDAAGEPVCWTLLFTIVCVLLNLALDLTEEIESLRGVLILCGESAGHGLVRDLLGLGSFVGLGLAVYLLALRLAQSESRAAAEVERVKAERECELAELQSQRLESLGLLAGGIAHDFNNLLVGILGSADLLALEIAGHRRAEEEVGQIRSAADRAAGLCRQMLAYAGRAPTERTRVDMGRVVADAIDLARPGLFRTVAVTVGLEPGLPAVFADRSQLDQIVLNLVRNAAEAIGEDPGRIEVGVRSVMTSTFARTERLKARFRGSERLVLLEVADSGAGVDAATRERMFDPFFSTKETGRGLGLASVVGAVRSHGGFLGVQSEPEGGTRVRVVLPAMNEDDPRPR